MITFAWTIGHATPLEDVTQCKNSKNQIMNPRP